MSFAGDLLRAASAHRRATAPDPLAWNAMINLGDVLELSDNAQAGLAELENAYTAMGRARAAEMPGADRWRPALGILIASRYLQKGQDQTSETWLARVLNDHAALATLAKLRALGFRIALDDFGTGYSSLSYLQRYPIDKIKIDRSFISNLGTDPSADAVVNAIVRLARALRLDVIAEGVETELQRIRLAAAGCDDIQGYLFGKSMPAHAIGNLLEGVSSPAMRQEHKTVQLVAG
ncbi:MAG: EAL domain-containing protein [Hyphomonas sp.]|uniref:EAL domain-containing protein n=1 Tax=Hyphomonas sp. TaxID=87 RepID=UPI00349FFAF8